MADTDYQVIIVGGGMVGATIACALGDTPLKVALVEATPAEREWPADSWDIRVSAITRATQRVFEAVGAWEGMSAMRVSPYRTMHVWDATGKGAIHFDCAELGEPDLGYIVENRVILKALLDRLADLPNVDLLCPAKVKSLHCDPGEAKLELEDGQVLRGRVVVGCDGARSWVREQAGIGTTGWMYDQTAVVATIKTSRHHGEAAYQRFMPTGPLAFLPLPEGLSSIVWSTTPEHAAELLALPDSEFLDRLQHAFGDTLGRMESTGPRGGFPLMLQHANRYVGERVVLAGNAAHAIHPLAGQGLNLGVSDAAALAEVLLKARAEGRDIGEYGVLRRYERWRKGDNVAVMAAMDGFKRLFSNDLPPLRLARNLGLRVADAAGPLKRSLMRRALGVTGDLPRLSRGLGL